MPLITCFKIFKFKNLSEKPLGSVIDDISIKASGLIIYSTNDSNMCSSKGYYSTSTTGRITQLGLALGLVT